MPDTKVIYAAVESEEQFIEEREQPAKQQHLISHDEHIESVQVDNSDSGMEPASFRFRRRFLTSYGLADLLLRKKVAQ